VVTTELHITGRVAQFGRGILGDVSKKLMAQFASNLNTMLDDQGTAVSGNGDTGDPGGAAESSTPSETDHATQTATADLPPAGADQSGPQPRVRKIEGPATEPVDLAGVAGPAILKRLAPLLVALAVVLVLLRRRR
jgi:hypothetical protein